ncbi:MAG: MBL fold metallo-hydrolase [Bacteroidetes bacterium]|nr:MBL fold metallo-hydrolase [Bacteroidota bacterium]
MITIKNFVFNSFQVNTYLLYDETKECVIIDAACFDKREEEKIVSFIESENLKPVKLINTHSHIDHVLGNSFISKKYNLGLEIHEGGIPLVKSAPGYASVFGFEAMDVVNPTGFYNDGDIIKFGNSQIQVLYTPGHADGSVCFYNKEQDFVIVGDVLFLESIGRTDLPSGNHELLLKSIREKLFTLPNNTEVLTGHGPSTTIGHEKENNYFLRD